MKHIHIAFLPLIGFLVSCSPTNSNEGTFSGSLEMSEHLVGARVAGRVTELSADEGSVVQKGQVLARLDRYDQAHRDYQRVLQLKQAGGLSEQIVENAELTLQDQQILSPVQGVVLVKIKEEGEVVAPGSPIFDIGDQNDLWVRIYIPEGRINQVHLHQPATIHFDGLKQEFKGEVSYIAVKPEFTPRNVQTPEERITQTFAVKVRLENPSPDLRPGVAADVTLKFGER